jgi:hypothetical protein
MTMKKVSTRASDHARERCHERVRETLSWAGAMREVFFAYELFPRYVGYARNVAEYFPKGNQVLCARALCLPFSFCFFTRCFSPVLSCSPCPLFVLFFLLFFFGTAAPGDGQLKNA